MSTGLAPGSSAVLPGASPVCGLLRRARVVALAAEFTSSVDRGP
jgi:hypothetical protein